MENSDFIKDILVQIKATDPASFRRFESEHSLCFQKDKGYWLFPMLYNTNQEARELGRYCHL